MIQQKKLSSNPLVSIIIPTFNRAEALNRCLDSLIDQTFKDFEVLVCDDGSTDKTKEIVEKFTSSLNIQYYYDKNFGGPARPRNIGIKMARGKYVAFLDSDDWWLSEKLAVSVEALDAGEDLVYHDLYVFYENKSKSTKLKKLMTRELVHPVFDDLLLNGNAINNSSVVVRKSILEKAGNISEDVDLISVEDYDYWLHVAQITSRFVRLDGCFGWYCVGSDNISKSVKKLHQAQLSVLNQYSNHALYLSAVKNAIISTARVSARDEVIYPLKMLLQYAQIDRLSILVLIKVLIPSAVLRSLWRYR